MKIHLKCACGAEGTWECQEAWLIEQLVDGWQKRHEGCKAPDPQFYGSGIPELLNPKTAAGVVMAFAEHIQDMRCGELDASGNHYVHAAEQWLKAQKEQPHA